MRGLLIMGPTGAGKTPLGDLLAREGLWGRRCAHLDFGAELRRVASGHGPRMGAADRVCVRDVLKSGALLEKETFRIAERIVKAFLAGNRLGREDWLALNGLPRHVAQAADVDRLVQVKAIAYLRCPPEVVRERIRVNSGGDRTGRRDDSLSEIRRKLKIFRERTLPLLDHYRSKGVSIARFDVAVPTTPEQLLRRLATFGPPELGGRVTGLRE